MKQRFILQLILISISLTSGRVFALSYKCVVTGSAPVAREFIIQNAKEDNGGGTTNEKAFISLDAKKKIFGVTTRQSREVEYYIEFEAHEKKYVVKVRIPNGSEEQPAYVDVLPEGTYDNNLKHWVSCEKVNDLAADPKEIIQKVCKAVKLKTMSDVFTVMEEEPVTTEEGNFFNFKFPSGLIIKAKKEELNVVSYTLPPGVKCKR